VQLDKLRKENMKTSILISGQISGNFTLANKISVVGNDIMELKNGMFNSKIIVFETKRAAEKALWEAYKSLRQDKEDAQASRLRYSKGYISYDASTAKITEE
jgi:hypothetical protein